MATPTTSTSIGTGPTASERWRRWRFPVLVVLGVLLTALILGLVASQNRRGYLDPRGVDLLGAGAVVQLLADQGVRVTEVSRTDAAVDAAGPDSTIFIAVPDLLLPEQVDAILDTGADVVLIGPGPVLSAFGAGISLRTAETSQVREPRCDLPEAARAGSARLGGGYDAEPPATSCYDETLVATTLDGGQRVVAVGSADPFTNRYLDQDGNAALALGLLGHHRDLVWYRPVPEDFAGAQPQPLTELLPGWVVPVAWQLGIAALLAAWWRARRVGRVVTEPLPVVVRAAEATEGRARLYRRGRARQHAAATLREATAQRLRQRLGSAADAGTAALAEAVSDRTGRPVAEVSALLAGSPPADDLALVRLADDLDILDLEVRSL
jgi:Domain of unknown function (DUF4350)